jgi:protease-4
MKRIVTRAFTIIGALILAGFVLVLGIGVALWLTPARVPAKTILEADFERGLVEYVPNDPLASVLLAPASTVRDVVEALERAALDDRVRVLVAKVGATEMSLAATQELRGAITAFRRSGKPAIAYAETFGEFGPGNGAYYMATAFDEIYLQPSGDVGLTGLIRKTLFLRGTLDTLGLTPRLDHRGEYKTAMNLFTERQYTEPHEEVARRVLTSQFGQIVRGIAESRGLSEGEVEALIDRGPFSAPQALEAKLVDGLAYRDEVYAKVRSKAGEGAQRLRLSAYLERAGRPHTEGPTIALIYGVGRIKRGESAYDPIFQAPSMGAETLAAAFRAAIKDEDIKAILFRVDSPGGSYVASDTIWREVVRARQAGKPVVVSMGGAAASGGYFVAAPANKIVAQPATLTGSIGVVAGKLLTNGLWDKVGVSLDEVHTSANATFWSTAHDYSPQQWTQLQDWLDRIYDDFVTKVAAGRDLSKMKVLEVAGGRVWTGEDAKALGLVDELGGFPAALRLVKEAVGVPPDAEVRLQVFPPQKTLWGILWELLRGEGEEGREGQVTAALTRGLEFTRPLVHLLNDLGLGPAPGVLTMPHMGRVP